MQGAGGGVNGRFNNYSVWKILVINGLKFFVKRGIIE
jgi:hypothetical protein